MAWRLQLADHATTAVHLLAGLVTVYSGPQTVHFFDKSTGAFYGSAHFDFPPTSELPLSYGWRASLDGLRAPDGTYLPRADFGSGIVHISHDGRLHLLHFDDGRLVLAADGQVSPITHPETDGRFIAAALDRELGTLAAVDDRGWLHLYQQHIAMGSYEVSDATPGHQLLILLPDAADQVCIVTPSQIQMVDMTGQKLARAVISDSSGIAACSPDGQLLVVAESGLERITAYDHLLQPMWRANVVELLARASPAQLIEEPGVALDSLCWVAVDDEGWIASTWGGWVCVTTLAEFDVMPRPQSLL